jgi:hypothetical protein
VYVPGEGLYEVVRAAGGAGFERLCPDLCPALVSLREGGVPFAGTACIGRALAGLNRTFVDLARAMVY